MVTGVAKSERSNYNYKQSVLVDVVVLADYKENSIIWGWGREWLHACNELLRSNAYTSYLPTIAGILEITFCSAEWELVPSRWGLAIADNQRVNDVVET